MLAPTKDDAGHEKRLSNDEVFDTLVALLFAGSDTSTCNMTWLLKLLSDNPGALDRLREEHLALRKAQSEAPEQAQIEWEDMESLRHANQVIFEMLQMHPPVIGSFRKAKKGLAFKECLMPKGRMVAFDFQSVTREAQSTTSQARCSTRIIFRATQPLEAYQIQALRHLEVVCECALGVG